LVFENEGLTDASLRVLAESPHLSRLRRLDLAGNHITGTGAALLLDTPGLPALTDLDLRGNRLGPQDRQRLHERFGEHALF
jgi:hypothetical protein